MGNYVSCALMENPSTKTSKSARVIFQNSEILQIKEPIKAAELMLESPNFFLANSVSLRIGRRFSPLVADEDLEFGNVYVMFPMKRLNSIVTAGDLGVIYMAAKKGSGGKARILPNMAAVESENGGGEGLLESEFKFRKAGCRSRKPMLETIKEECVSLR